MAVKIIAIAPKVTPQATDKVAAHIAIERFKWLNEQDSVSGVSSLEVMFDWIVNRKGRAYVRTAGADGQQVPVFGAVSPTGKKYIRALKDNQWSDDLLTLPLIEG